MVVAVPCAVLNSPLLLFTEESFKNPSVSNVPSQLPTNPSPFACELLISCWMSDWLRMRFHTRMLSKYPVIKGSSSEIQRRPKVKQAFEILKEPGSLEICCPFYKLSTTYRTYQIGAHILCIIGSSIMSPLSYTCFPTIEVAMAATCPVSKCRRCAWWIYFASEFFEATTCADTE